MLPYSEINIFPPESDCSRNVLRSCVLSKNKPHSSLMVCWSRHKEQPFMQRPFSNLSVTPYMRVYVHACIQIQTCRNTNQTFRYSLEKPPKINKNIPHNNWISIGFLFLVQCLVFLVWDDNFILSLREQLTCPWPNDPEQLPKLVSYPQEKTVPGEGTHNHACPFQDVSLGTLSGNDFPRGGEDLCLAFWWYVCAQMRDYVKELRLYKKILIYFALMVPWKLRTTFGFTF